MTKETTALATRQEKPQLVAGGDVAAIVPRTLDEVYRLSVALSQSGMAPSSLKNAEQVMVAIMAGAELGLPPFQSLQSFAVINGRPTIWGDGLVAVARAGGAKIKEWLEGEAEAPVAHCRVTRSDGEEIERTFSVADAKRANLWGKQGPWQQYPQRMLAMRARAFALRDGCADMLRGMQVREEVEDYSGAPLRDVTPVKTGLMARLPGAGAAGISEATVEEGIATEQPVDERALDEILDGDYVPDFAPAPSDGDAAAQDEAPPARAPDDTPVDMMDPGEFDAWARDRLEKTETTAALDLFLNDPTHARAFARLEKDDPKAARDLDRFSQVRRREIAAEEAKALADREGG